MMNRVFLGVNYWNDVVFGATIGGVLAHIGNYWYYPYVLNYSEKRLQPAESGNEPYIHVSFLDYGKVLVFTAALPFFITVAVLNAHKGEIDWEFKKQVMWQKVYLGNTCQIDTDNPAEILQYKHFIHSLVVVACFGSWAG